MRSSVALRTCVACRGKDEKQYLLRILRHLGGEGDHGNQKFPWIFDFNAVLPGRALYCHPTTKCLRSPRLIRALSVQERSTPEATGQKVARQDKAMAGSRQLDVFALMRASLEDASLARSGGDLAYRSRAGSIGPDRRSGGGNQPGTAGREEFFRLCRELGMIFQRQGVESHMEAEQAGRDSRRSGEDREGGETSSKKSGKSARMPVGGKTRGVKNIRL